VNTMQLEQDILKLVRAVKSEKDCFGPLSTGQKCAVALVLDDPDLMHAWGTALDCMYRLDSSWLQACLNVQRNRDF
jgi:hypothetical protein